MKIEEMAGQLKTEDSFAVMKKGRKNALQVSNSYEEAKQYCIMNDYAHYAPYPADDCVIFHSGISIVKRGGNRRKGS